MNAVRYGELCARPGQNIVGSKEGVLVNVEGNIHYKQIVSKGALWGAVSPSGLGPAHRSGSGHVLVSPPHSTPHDWLLQSHTHPLFHDVP